MTNYADSASTQLRLRRDALQWREVDGEVIALEGRAATYLAANATGTVLWRALATGTTRADLVATLVEQFGIDKARASDDVDAFLRELAAQDLLEQGP
jgi:Coenzyme PQQ synthesis protein D (PqqD)